MERFTRVCGSVDSDDTSALPFNKILRRNGFVIAVETKHVTTQPWLQKSLGPVTNLITENIVLLGVIYEGCRRRLASTAHYQRMHVLNRSKQTSVRCCTSVHDWVFTR